MEGRELPVGWELIRLSEAAEWGSGGTPSRRNLDFYGDKIPWIKTGELGPRYIMHTKETISDLGLANSSAKIFPEGSIAIAMYGATIGKVSILGVPAATNQACAVAAVYPGVCSSEYFFHYLCSQRDEFVKAGKGGAQPNISQGLIKDWPIPLAPLNEQRRIAAKLDTTLAAVEVCRQRLDGVAAILKRFRQAVLAAATSGGMTRELASNSLWKEISITDVCEVVRGASPRPAGDQRYFGGMGTVPWITVGELTKDSDKYLLSTSCFLTDAGMSKSRRIMPGTLLLTNSGVTLGVPKISLIEGCINDGSVALLGLEEPLKSYVYYVLRSKTQDLRSINQGAAQPNLNTSIVKAIRFMVPDSSKEQSEVVRRIEELFTLANQLETRLSTARKIVDRLTPALLAKAFRGELVPQEPTDEPASLLLERIRAARQAEAAAGKPSRRGRPKAAANPEPIALEAAPVSADFLTRLLRECGALSERALLAASELEPQQFQRQLQKEQERGIARAVQGDGQVLLEAVG
jgi:type I restriction enzyme S subunit